MRTRRDGLSGWTVFLAGVVCLMHAATAQAGTILWAAEGMPPNSFDLEIGQLVSTAISECDDSIVTATWVDTDGVAIAPFPGRIDDAAGRSSAYAFIGAGNPKGSGIDLVIDFGVGVRDLNFFLHDIDASSWVDQVIVTAESTDGEVLLKCGNGSPGTDCEGFVIEDNVATGVSSTTFFGAEGRVKVFVPGDVQSVNVRYQSPVPTVQATFGVSAFRFVGCPK